MSVTTLALGDARVIAYDECGEPGGVPVLRMHGTPGSRLERLPDERIYHDLGIRLVTIDRPGYGHSSPCPGRTLSDWACDVEKLADHLGIDRFHVAGMCGGGPYAIACAASPSK